MRTLNVVVVNGSPSTPSKSVAVADLVVDTLAELVPVSTQRVDAYQLGTGLASAIIRDEVSDEVEEQLRAIERADVLVAATPVYRGSYPGIFKHLFDLLDPYSLANKLVILTATGGSERHALMIEHQLRPLFAFFQAAVAPVAYFVSAGDIDGTTILNAEVYSRVQVGLRDIVPQLTHLSESS